MWQGRTQMFSVEDGEGACGFMPPKEMMEVLTLTAQECALVWNGVCACVISSK